MSTEDIPVHPMQLLKRLKLISTYSYGPICMICYQKIVLLNDINILFYYISSNIFHNNYL